MQELRKLKKASNQLLYVTVLLLTLNSLTSCGETKYIVKVKIEKVYVPKFVPIAQELTEPELIPVWDSASEPTGVDLKHLFVETREVLRLVLEKLKIMRNMQVNDE